jgi:hypothetical protein
MGVMRDTWVSRPPSMRQTDQWLGDPDNWPKALETLKLAARDGRSALFEGGRNDVQLSDQEVDHFERHWLGRDRAQKFFANIDGDDVVARIIRAYTEAIETGMRLNREAGTRVIHRIETLWICADQPKSDWFDIGVVVNHESGTIQVLYATPRPDPGWENAEVYEDARTADDPNVWTYDPNRQDRSKGVDGRLGAQDLEPVIAKNWEYPRPQST